MIYAYTGLPGSGKSLSALSDLLKELSAGRHVFCNIVGLEPMLIAAKLSTPHNIVSTSYVNKYLHRFSMSFSDDRANESEVRKEIEKRESVFVLSAEEKADIRKKAERKVYVKTLKDGSAYYANAEGLNLLVEDIMSHNETYTIIDECHEYLNPENWKVLRPFAKYISMARHYGHDLILITQHIMDIWPPLQRRVHETHDFFRGKLGIRTQYTEKIYYSTNLLVSPGATRQRLNDKSLYGLYRSHDNGAKEHMNYLSIFHNGKFRMYLVLLAVFGLFLIWKLPGLISRYSPEKIKEQNALPNAPQYQTADNIIYVKYVVCGSFDCKATRPDGTVLTLPLDYASGKYPIEVRKYVPSTNSGFNFGQPSNGSGVPNAPR